jgi:predicted alpha/beta superfamily hydrolase
MKRIALFIHLVLFTWSLTAQVTLRLTSIPANTPAGSTIYFAASINNWNPGDAAAALTVVNGVHQIVIPEGTGTVSFKFTRGAWASVEANASGQDIPNRTFTFTGSPQVINLSVLRWKDLVASTAAANVQILNPAFVMPQLGNRTRRIWLYLPPDYQSTSKRFPVLYMHDGQNLFDAATSFSGEWQVDETLNSLHASGNYGAIVVGIDNGGGLRLNEYSPWVNPQYGGGEGAAYIDFIAQTLKPYIDANFRTLADPQHTALFGSSMGALISLYGMVRYPQVFGKTGSFSPAYWFSFSDLSQFISNSTSPLAGTRVYHLGGQNESSRLVNDINTIAGSLLTKGISSTDSRIKIDADGAHSEWYWRREFSAAYQWLFPNVATSTTDRTVNLSLQCYPNPAQQSVQVKGYTFRPNDQVSIVSIHGIRMKHFTNLRAGLLPIGELQPGLYFLQVNGVTKGRFVKL